jgi:hypothetical protein
MNERIRKLSEQAEVKWLHQEDVIYSTMTLEQFEKFAQLIVRECAQQVNEETSWPYDSFGEKIRQHFGVEE